MINPIGDADFPSVAGGQTILNFQGFCLALFAVSALGGCAHQPAILHDRSVAASTAPNTQRVDAKAAIGSGPFRYRYILSGPNGKPQANTPFALSLRRGDLPFAADAKKIWQGVTDRNGRTPVFALPFPLAPEQVFLRPRFGSGPYGEQMAFSTPDGGPLGDVDYELVICTDPPTGMIGHADREGNLPYAASEQPARVVIKLLFATLVTDDDQHGVAAKTNHDPTDEWRATCQQDSLEFRNGANHR